MKITEKTNLVFDMTSEEEMSLRTVIELLNNLHKEDIKRKSAIFDKCAHGWIVEIDCFGVLADFLEEEILSRSAN